MVWIPAFAGMTVIRNRRVHDLGKDFSRDQEVCVLRRCMQKLMQCMPRQSESLLRSLFQRRQILDDVDQVIG